jgi:Tol biopolymer transport system component
VTAWDPSWSPNGKQIAFACELGKPDLSVDGVCVVTLASGAVRRLVKVGEDVFLGGVRWSPNGGMIAFEQSYFDASDTDHDEVRLLHLQSGKVTLLVDKAATPAWSPDGRTVAYSSPCNQFRESAEIYIIGANRTNGSKVAGFDFNAPRSGVPTPRWCIAWLAWSPDSKRFAFESGGWLFTMPTAGGDVVRVPGSRIRYWGIAWRR